MFFWFQVSRPEGAAIAADSDVTHEKREVSREQQPHHERETLTEHSEQVQDVEIYIGLICSVQIWSRMVYSLWARSRSSWNLDLDHHMFYSNLM